MIDIIIGQGGVLTVAHDERALDGFVALGVDLSDGAVVLSGPQGTRPLGHLASSMRALVGRDARARIVRVSGMSIPSVRDLALHVSG